MLINYTNTTENGFEMEFDYSEEKKGFHIRLHNGNLFRFKLVGDGHMDLSTDQPKSNKTIITLVKKILNEGELTGRFTDKSDLTEIKEMIEKL